MIKYFNIILFQRNNILVQFLPVLDTLGFAQVITKPTCIITTSTAIDLIIIVSDTQCIATSGTVHTYGF